MLTQVDPNNHVELLYDDFNAFLHSIGKEVLQIRGRVLLKLEDKYTLRLKEPVGANDFFSLSNAPVPKSPIIFAKIETQRVSILSDVFIFYC